MHGCAARILELGLIVREMDQQSLGDNLIQSNIINSIVRDYRMHAY